VRVISLASGSRGNAYLLECGGDWLLIDDGLAWRTLCCRWKEHSSQPAGVLVTHSHTDHTAGLATLASKLDVPLFANSITIDAVVAQGVDESAFVCFENGQEFSVGGFTVHPFSIPHDTGDPVGFLVRAGGETYFHGTDIGTPLDSIGLKLAEADVATLESNHDPVMLHTSGRHPSLIQRIAGPRGHLSNDECCELVRRFAAPKLKRLGLAHLSRDCNTPRLAETAMRENLAAMNRNDIAVKVYSQDEVVEI